MVGYILQVANENKYTYICSKHFLSGRPTEEHPDHIPAAVTSLDILRARRQKRRVLVRVNSENVLGPEENKIKNGTFDRIISKINIIYHRTIFLGYDCLIHVRTMHNQNAVIMLTIYAELAIITPSYAKAVYTQYFSWCNYMYTDKIIRKCTHIFI